MGTRQVRKQFRRGRLLEQRSGLKEGSVTDPRFTELCRFVEPEMARLHVPGVAFGVIEAGQTDTAGFGVTNVENPLPVHEATLFQIGSISKTVTATAAMRLVEQGLLDLNVPVRTYLPGLRLADEDVATRVTMRHLFS